jgi:nitroreductase
METKDVIEGRRCIRKFKDKRISDKQLDELIDAMILAPSAGNMQSRKFYIVKNKEIKEKLAEAALSQGFIAQVPVAIVICTDSSISTRYGKRGEIIYSLLDCGASIQNLLLRAYDLGLGGCWVGAFDEERVRKILSIPSNLRPVSIIPIGHPDESPSMPQRKSKKECCEFVD